MLRMPFPWSGKRPEQADTEKLFLKGKKVVLREKRVDDAPEDYAWRVDEELARLDATRPLRMSYDDFQRYSQEEMGYPSPRSKRLAIDTYDGTHIGNVMYYDIDLRRKEAELGIMIGDREYWGKGYGTDAVNSLIEHIFTTTQITRLYLHTLEWNDRARKSFTKSGFKEVKNVRRSGMDFVLMEIWRSDWQAPESDDSPNDEREASTEHIE